MNFKTCYSIKARKLLYTTLVRSQLTYCSQLWNPYMIKDTLTLEKVQRQATKFIPNDYESDYKTRLLKLDLLPLTYILDFYDILFFIKPSNSHHHISTLITTLHSVMLTLDLPLPTNFTMYTPTITAFGTFILTDCQDFGTPSYQLT